jgi:hypothetical protein
MSSGVSWYVTIPNSSAFRCICREPEPCRVGGSNAENLASHPAFPHSPCSPLQRLVVRGLETGSIRSASKPSSNMCDTTLGMQGETFTGS